MSVTRLNSVNATLLIRLYTILTRPYLDCAITAMTILNKSQRHKLEVIQNQCLSYARRALDFISISNNELRSRCNTVSVEQCILALAGRWWKKASKNNVKIINFIYHHHPDSTSKAPLNTIKSNDFF